MAFFRSLIVAIVGLAGSSAGAELPGLERAYDRLLTRTQEAIHRKIYDQTPEQCHPQALEIRADGRIDIAVVFGYMDVSGGQDFNDSATSLYRNGHVLDLDAKNALKAILKGPCPSRKMKACGFHGNGDTLTKRVRDRWGKTRLNVTVRLASPAVTPYNNQNSGPLLARQQQSSQQVKNIFLKALQTQDMTIYMGHARSGGGPDFLPPVLYSNGNVNYSHYRSSQEGIGSMLAALERATEPSSVIGVLACKSTRLFANRIRSKAPDSLLVTADELFDYNDILPTGYAMIEAVLNQRCSSEFSDMVKVQPKSESFLDIRF